MPRRYRTWSVQDKLEIIEPVMKNEISISAQAKKYEISIENIYKWIKRFKNMGAEGLKNKHKPGNPLVKYQSLKALTEVQKLEYENLKLRIENERLKKAYVVKGDGTVLIHRK